MLVVLAATEIVFSLYWFRSTRFLLVVFYMLPVFPWDSRSSLFLRLWFLLSLLDVIMTIIPNTAISFNTMGSDTRFYIFSYVRNLVIYSCVSELVWTAREYYGVLAREWETGPRDVVDLPLGLLVVTVGQVNRRYWRCWR